MAPRQVPLSSYKQWLLGVPVSWGILAGTSELPSNDRPPRVIMALPTVVCLIGFSQSLAVTGGLSKTTKTLCIDHLVFVYIIGDDPLACSCGTLKSFVLVKEVE